MPERRRVEERRRERLDRYRKLFVEEWRRQRITNVDMASRLGRSLSLVNKLKKGSTPLTGPLIEQLYRILEIDPIRAMFAVDIAQSHLCYYDPKFRSACAAAITFFDRVVVEFDDDGDWVERAAADDLIGTRVDASAREAAAIFVSSLACSRAMERAAS